MTMNSRCRLRSGLFLLLLLSFPFHSSADDDVDSSHASGDVKVIGEIMEWIRSHGGWISDKLEVRQIAGPLSGIFTKESLEDKEMVAEIPWDLIVKPPSPDLEQCEKATHVRSLTTKDPKDQNPYEKYLASRSANHIPLFWSRAGKELLAELMDDFFTNGFEHDVDETWQEECQTTKDETHDQALMLLHTRGEGERIDLLVPFGDLMNHRNGDYTNADPDMEYGKHYRIVTTRAVQAGEQIQNSYNQCKFCKGLYSNPEDPSLFQVAPQIFEIYGFVESVPQRWVVPDARMIFDIIHAEDQDEEDEDEFEVDYIVPPSRKGLSYLRRRLAELKDFEEKLTSHTDIPQDEIDGISTFYAALVNAYSMAVEHSAGEISERVWQLGSKSWQLEESSHHYGDDDEL